jgi:hypothetical protein
MINIRYVLASNRTYYRSHLRIVRLKKQSKSFPFRPEPCHILFDYKPLIKAKNIRDIFRYFGIILSNFIQKIIGKILP